MDPHSKVDDPHAGGVAAVAPPPAADPDGSPELNADASLPQPSQQPFELDEATQATLLAPPVVDASWRVLLHHLTRYVVNGAPLAAADLLTGAACILLANETVRLLTGAPGFEPASKLLFLLPALFASLGVMGLYPGIGLSPVVELRKLCLAAFSLVTAMLGVSLYASAAPGSVALLTVVLLPLLLVALPTSRSLARSLLAKQPWWGEPVLVFGGGPTGFRVHRMLERDARRGMRSKGVIAYQNTLWRGATQASGAANDDTDWLGPPDEAERFVREFDAQWAVIACEKSAGGVSAKLSSEVLSDEHTREALSKIPNRLVIGGAGLPSLWTESRECAGAAALHVGERLLMPWPQFIKRTVDIGLSLAVGVVITPLMLLISLAIKLTSPGPVLYGHGRIGQDGRRFKVWKFRTMFTNADQHLKECLDSDERLREEWMRDQKMKRDPRITSVGGFLRKSSLDELPQLWNVFRGEMSLVGPRPIVEEEVAKYRHVYPMYKRVRPGITGLWQISGRNRTTYDERVELDNYYVRNWSPWLDIYILARTVRTVLLREGAY
ncbi:MAG: undecaprenyl-phosphate galactose phosphotransferase WbaP [Planctomycetota bacterium]